MDSDTLEYPPFGGFSAHCQKHKLQVHTVLQLTSGGEWLSAAHTKRLVVHILVQDPGTIFTVHISSTGEHHMWLPLALAHYHVHQMVRLSHSQGEAAGVIPARVALLMIHRKTPN